MIFAQFYHMTKPSEWNNHEPQLVASSEPRGRIVYSTTRRLANVKADAGYEAHRRRYAGFALFSGDSFSTAKRISGFIPATTFAVIQGALA